MTSEELTLLTDHAVYALKPYIEQLVSTAMAEIPHQIRDRVNPFVDKEIDRYIKQRIDEQVVVYLTLKGDHS